MTKKTAVVTGANTGIGLSITKLFMDKGYEVFAIYHRDNNNLVEMDQKNLKMFPCELSDISEVKDLANKILQLSDVDILVNAAGTYSLCDSFENISMDDLDMVLNVNLKAPMILSQVFVPKMKERKWGRVINLSSTNVQHGGGPSTVHYTISKTGLEMLSRVVAKDASPYNVLSNSIRVGATDTTFHHKNPNKNMSERLKCVKIGRMAEPKEIANMVYFLTTEEASYISGATINVDGAEF